MALTPVRWIAALVVLCAIGATLVLRPRDRRENQPQPRDRLAVVVRDARGAAVRAADALRILQVVDSVTRTPAWSASGATEWTMMDASLPPRVAADTRAFVDRAGAYRPDRPMHRVAVVALADRGAWVGGVFTRNSLDASYLLPADSASPCVVVLRLDPELRERRPAWWAAVVGSELHPRALLGPCGYYEWFGMPGQHVAEWLARGDWQLALVSAWQLEPVRWDPPAWYDRLNGDDWLLRAYTGLGGWRCFTGDRTACLEAALDPVAGSTTSGRQLTEGRVLPDVGLRFAFNEGRRHETLGPRATTYLAAMAHDLGPDRFQQFWRSEHPVADAFSQAAGRGLGSWTERWAARMYGARARGPGLAASGALLGLVIAGAALGGAFRVLRRRQAA